jgi:competence/damage-inducible protein CinA-like protein
MKAEIVSIGTELLLGSITDTNAAFLAQRLADLGIDCYYISQVGDNENRIVETLRRAIERSDLIVTTGGPGPTGDDLTRESIAALLGETPFVVPEFEENLRAFFTRRGAPMPEQNLKQATLIPSATSLKNPVGTAPGWKVTFRQAATTSHIISMPGVPYEMKRMWTEEVEPWLKPLCPTVLVSRTLKIMGLGESAVESKVADLMEGTNPTLAPYAKADGVNLRITAKATNADRAREMILPVEAEIRERLGEAIYGADDESPASVLNHLLTECDLRVALIEIGAGAIGAVSQPLSNYPGLAASLSATRAEDLSCLLSEAEMYTTLEQLSSALLDRCNANLVMAVRVEQQPGTESNTVRADADILLTSSPDKMSGHNTMSRATWNTSASEVGRLTGLGALNLLRKWLLDYKRNYRQVNA